MPSILFHCPDGSDVKVEARAGASVMETAVKCGVPGIVGKCGGGLACATCHVYVADGDLARTGAAGDFEDEMLDDATSERRPTSRLSCQIRMTDALDGLEVEIPPSQ